MMAAPPDEPAASAQVTGMRSTLLRGGDSAGRVEELSGLAPFDFLLGIWFGKRREHGQKCRFHNQPGVRCYRACAG